MPPFLMDDGDSPGKRRIMTGALMLFARRGLEGTSIRDIAAWAKTTNPALYKHFESKDTLALHLFIGCYRELWQRLQAGITAESGFDAKLSALVHLFTAYYDECPEAVLYINENVHRFWPRVPEAMSEQTLSILVRNLIEEGLATGAIQPGIAGTVRVVGIVGQLFQLGRMIYLDLMEGPASRWAHDLHGQIRQMLR